jgi:segregation and condensation protein B
VTGPDGPSGASGPSGPDATPASGPAFDSGETGPGEGATLTAQVEAVLFVAERPVTVSELARLLHVSPDSVEDAVAGLEGRLAGGGLTLQRHADALQVVTHPRVAGPVQRFLGLEMSSRLSPAALETLAIVAYRQPVTRAQIEVLRGVNVDGVLGNLVTRGLVEEVGRLDAVGRPILYGTTFEFLRAFGLRRLEDLPPAGELGAPAAPAPPSLEREQPEGLGAGNDAGEAGLPQALRHPAGDPLA